MRKYPTYAREADSRILEVRNMGEGFSTREKKLLFRNMVRGRRFDEAVNELCRKSILPGMWHSGIGHEATQAGAASFLRQDDWLGLTHRGITAGLAKGLDPKMWMAETLARVGGYGKGKCRKAADRRVGVLPGGGTIGSAFPIAAGAGVAAKHAEKGQVVVCLFGDGAAQRGTLHESMNMASVWKLPVIWVCENNLYYITTHIKDAMALEHIADLAASYDMPGTVVDGQDILAVSTTVLWAIQRARTGEGPSLIECKTYRYREHGEFDIDPGYRPRGEIEEWRKRDPIEILRKRLLEEGSVAKMELDRVDQEVEREVDEVTEWALDSPEPGTEEAFLGVFLDSSGSLES
jgi:TPP-dependent pyruvate/acetoin dehydrogenase alpha subunit